MGQYYKACLIRKDSDGAEHPSYYTTYQTHDGAKLTEFSWVRSAFMNGICGMLYRKGLSFSERDEFRAPRVAFIGDYWDGAEVKEDWVLACTLAWHSYGDVMDEKVPMCADMPYAWQNEYAKPMYFVNRDKFEYFTIDPDDYVNNELNPLGILCAVGNGRGGGDYKGTHMELVGSWAFDHIEIVDEEPTDLYKIPADFVEDY